MTDSKVSPRALLQYGVIAAPVAFAGFPLYVLAPDFFATRHGASLAAMGGVLLFLRLFDAFQDPVIGYLSDRFRAATKLYMLASAMILCLSVYGMFNQLYLSPLVWFAICMGFAVTAYSVLSINLNALGALWTTDPLHQTRIAAYREAFALVGLVVAVSLPSLLAFVVPERLIYPLFSITLAGLMTGALVLLFRWQRRYPPNIRQGKPKQTLSLALFSQLCPESKKLLLVYLLSMLASSIPAVLVLFFVRDLLGGEAYAGAFLLLYFLSGALLMGVWKRLSVVYGKHLTWLLSMLLAVAGFIWAFFLDSGDLWQYGVICVVSGMALGADLAFPPSLLADHLHKHHNESSASTHYALLTLLAKAALALASVIALPLLGQAGFIPNSANSAAALLALSTAYALVPCALKLLAGAVLWYSFIYSGQGDSHEDQEFHRTTGSSHHV